MANILRTGALIFSAGAAGGLVCSLVVWFSALMGITVGLETGTIPELTPDWLYPRVIWGGLWGALFFIPFLSNAAFLRGCFYSLGPSLIQLQVVYPLQAGKDLLELNLGLSTLLLIFFFNATWGVTAALLLKEMEEG